MIGVNELVSEITKTSRLVIRRQYQVNPQCQPSLQNFDVTLSVIVIILLFKSLLGLPAVPMPSTRTILNAVKPSETLRQKGLVDQMYSHNHTNMTG